MKKQVELWMNLLESRVMDRTLNVLEWYPGSREHPRHDSLSLSPLHVVLVTFTQDSSQTPLRCVGAERETFAVRSGNIQSSKSKQRGAAGRMQEIT